MAIIPRILRGNSISKFGTTTFAQRHQDKLSELKNKCLEKNITKPTILEFGPGGIVSIFFALWQEGNRFDLPPLKRALRIFGRCLENLTRRFDLFKLKTTEPYEIITALGDLYPDKIIILDKQDKVLRDLNLQFKKNPPLINFETGIINLEDTANKYSGDIVIAYFVVERCEDKGTAMMNLFASVRPQGFLSTTYSMTPPCNFTILKNGLYYRHA